MPPSLLLPGEEDEYEACEEVLKAFEQVFEKEVEGQEEEEEEEAEEGVDIVMKEWVEEGLVTPSLPTYKPHRRRVRWLRFTGSARQCCASDTTER